MFVEGGRALRALQGRWRFRILLVLISEGPIRFSRLAETAQLGDKPAGVGGATSRAAKRRAHSSQRVREARRAMWSIQRRSWESSCSGGRCTMRMGRGSIHSWEENDMTKLLALSLLMGMGMSSAAVAAGKANKAQRLSQQQRITTAIAFARGKVGRDVASAG